MKPFDPTLLAEDPVAAAVRRGRAPLRAQLTAGVGFGIKPVDPVAPIEPHQRETARIPYLAERRRVELMLLPRMLYRVLEFGASDPNHPDAVLVLSLLRDAMVEPINGLPVRQAEKLLHRVTLPANRIMDDFFNDAPNAKAAAVIWYAIQHTLETALVELYEGSSMADALQLMLPMFDYAIDTAAADRSALKRSRKFIVRLQRVGYFR